MNVMTQPNTIDPELSHRLHSIAMDRSNDDYDNVKTKLMPVVNSICPGEWLAETCIPGIWEPTPGEPKYARQIEQWGPVTEESESAKAIAESHGRLTYQRLLRYPLSGPLNLNGDELFLRCWTHSNPARSTIDPASVQQFTYAEPRSSKQDYETPKLRQAVESKTNPKTKKPKAVSKAVIKSGDVNEAYNAAYGSKEATATPFDVLEVVLGYIQHKFHVGIEEKTLRQRGLEDEVMTFYQKMQQILETGQFVLQPGKTFSSYVKTCWKRHCLDAYKSLKATDNRFENSTPVTTRNFNANGEATLATKNKADEYVLKLRHRGMTRTDPETAIALPDIMARRDINSAVAQYLMDGMSQAEIADSLAISRHAVSRARKRIGRQMRRSDRVAR